MSNWVCSQDGFEQRGLPGTRWANDSYELTSLNLHIYVIKHRGIAVGARDVFAVNE
jgi:hypothetical protein